MKPRTRLIIAALVGIVVAVVGAYGLSEENYIFAALACGICIWVAIEWLNGPIPEAWCLALPFFGYIVGNRGFAQLVLTSRFPLFPAEAALAVVGPGLLIRSLIHKRSLVRPDPLNIALLCWMGYATARLPLDVSVFGFIALRDYALIYYATFFYLSQYLARDGPSRKLLKKAATLAFICLPVVVIANHFAPDFFLDTLTWNGTPLIYHKSDLVAASLVCGSFWFWSLFENDRRKIWLLASGLSLLLIAMTDSPRAAMVAAVALTAAWVAARRVRLIWFQLATIVIGLAVATPIELGLGTPLEQTKAFGMYERTVSVVDLSHSHTYQSADALSTGDNNQFRLVWWKAVYDETLSQNPVFGMGFGYDLAARFLADYEWLGVEEEFSVRSPHSVILTTFGRLGAVGLLLLVVVGALSCCSAWRSFKANDYETMGWWSVAGVIGTSACFGVVLEGPMGAVVFWIALGIAHEQANERTKNTPDLAEDALPTAAEIVSSIGA